MAKVTINDGPPGDGVDTQLTTHQPGRVGKRPFICPPFTSSKNEFGGQREGRLPTLP